MERETYTKPEFGFQEMELFERVAEQCWGTAQLWVDANGDQSITDGLDIGIETGGGCRGNWAADTLTTEINTLNAALSSFNASGDYSILTSYKSALGEWAIANNVKSISLVTATPDSSWANTKTKSGGGIIIIGS